MAKKPKISIKMEGLDEAIAAFNRFDRDSREAMRKAVKKSSNRLRKGIIARAPQGPTGNLKKSIGTKYAKDGLSSQVGPRSGKGGSHAHLVEFGHVVVMNGKVMGHSPAKPFITPAAEDEKPKYLDDIRKGIKGAVR